MTGPAGAPAATALTIAVLVADGLPDVSAAVAGSLLPAEIILVGGQPGVGLPAGIRHVPWSPDEGAPWGQHALDTVSGEAVLLLHAGEVIRGAPAVEPGAPVALVPVRVAAGDARGGAVIELEPRLVRRDAGRVPWGPDGLPLVLEAPAATGLAIGGKHRRWDRPGELLALVTAESRSVAEAPLTLALASALARRGEIEAAGRALSLARGWLEARDSPPPLLFAAELDLADALAASAGADALLAFARECAPSPELAGIVARQLLAEWRLEEAEDWWYRALSYPPEGRILLREHATGVLPWWGLGEVATAQGRHMEAAAWFARAAGSLDSAVARVRVALSLAWSGQDREAADALERALGGRPGGDALAAVCQICMDTGDYGGAVEAARLRIARGEPAFLDRARALCALGEHELALDDAWTQVALEPRNVEALLLLARCSLASGIIPDAVSACSRALKLAPGDARALAGMAAAQLASGEPVHAVTAARAALDADPGDREGAMLLVRALHAAGQVQEAFERLVRMAEAGAADREACLALVNLLLEADEPALAASYASAALEDPGPGHEDAPLLRQLAEALRRTGQLTHAARAEDLAALLAPGSSPGRPPGPRIAADSAPVLPEVSGHAGDAGEASGAPDPPRCPDRGPGDAGEARGMLRMLLNVGCGDARIPGWLNVDIEPTADMVVDATQPLPWPDATFDCIYNEHFIEHITVEQAVAFLRECGRVLVPGGTLRIATPDLAHLLERATGGNWRDQDWLSWPQFQFIQTRAEMVNIAMRWWGHQYLYDEEELTRRLAEAGFSRWRRVAWGESEHELLRGLETRLDSALIIEAYGG